ncbi:MAG: hypothetical protein RL701_6956 [Pseudomonadota bacterium]|jgi:hypothetical protein
MLEEPSIRARLAAVMEASRGTRAAFRREAVLELLLGGASRTVGATVTVAVVEPERNIVALVPAVGSDRRLRIDGCTIEARSPRAASVAGPRTTGAANTGRARRACALSAAYAPRRPNALTRVTSTHLRAAVAAWSRGFSYAVLVLARASRFPRTGCVAHLYATRAAGARAVRAACSLLHARAPSGPHACRLIARACLDAALVAARLSRRACARQGCARAGAPFAIHPTGASATRLTSLDRAGSALPFAGARARRRPHAVVAGPSLRAAATTAERARTAAALVPALAAPVAVIGTAFAALRAAAARLVLGAGTFVHAGRPRAPQAVLAHAPLNAAPAASLGARAGTGSSATGTRRSTRTAFSVAVATHAAELMHENAGVVAVHAFLFSRLCGLWIAVTQPIRAMTILTWRTAAVLTGIAISGHAHATTSEDCEAEQRGSYENICALNTAHQARTILVTTTTRIEVISTARPPRLREPPRTAPRCVGPCSTEKIFMWPPPERCRRTASGQRPDMMGWYGETSHEARNIQRPPCPCLA